MEERVVAVEAILRNKGRDVCSVSPDALVYDAVKMMSDRNIGSVLVMQESRLLGIVSERDYARKVLLKGKSSKVTLVKEIMTHPVIFVSPWTTVAECMRIMTTNRIRHLPVLDDDRVAGVISIGDLVNWIICSQQETILHLEGYITGRYPG